MPNIRHELIIGAPVEKVYNAITSQQGLSAWWTPDTTAKQEVASVSRFPFGPTYFKEMKIIVLDPFKRVEWECIAGAQEWIGTTLSFGLEAGDQSAVLNKHPEILGQLQQSSSDLVTCMVFQHDGWKEYTPMFAECNYTWGQFLRSLKLLCETGKGTPWPNQHRST
jgi:uncharacterized protein YndB with AHSA1/START domain